MQLCSGKKKSVSCLGAASQHDYESIVPLQNDTFSSWKGVYWRHNFCWFPQAKRKEAVWFCFIAYCIVFDASNIMRDELHHHYTSLSNIIKWVFFIFSWIYLKIYSVIILKYLFWVCLLFKLFCRRWKELFIRL